MESFDPLKTRSSSSSSVIRDSRDSLAVSDELGQLLQQPGPTAMVPVQKERKTLAKSSSASWCTLDNEQLHTTSEVDSNLRHARSDPMLLEQQETNQWNGMNTRHRSSSCDELEEQFTRSERSRSSPMFCIDPCEGMTSSLVAIQQKKNQTLTQPTSILYRLSPKSSPKTSPKHSPRHSPQSKRHSASVALPKSSKLVSKSKVQANSPALSKRKPRSATVDALVSSSEYERSRVQLARYFRPGVLMLKDLNPRMCIIQSKLKEREKEFCTTSEIK